MPPEYQNLISMDGHDELVTPIYSGTHPRMPKPPEKLLRADPLKYLKTFLVLLRPSRLRENEQDYTPLDSKLISTDDRKEAIAWISPKLISIMNENAELERQVKNQGPRRTKVLSADVYQAITPHKMRAEEWRGSDFSFCLAEAMKRLPREEIKNTRFLLRLGRSPLNGVAARCAADTTRELGLSLREWINARCVNGNGARMNLLCHPIDDAAMHEHALALEAAPRPPRAGGAAASTRSESTPQPPQPQPKIKPQRVLAGKKKNRRSLKSTLNTDDEEEEEPDDASDSDYAAEQQPPRKKTARTSTSKMKANPKSKSKAAAPSTPAGKQIKIKDEIWSSA